MTTDTENRDDDGAGPGGHSQEWYASALDAVDAGACRFDAESRIVDATDRFLDTVGYDREALLGEHASRLIDDVEGLERAIRRLHEADPDAVQSLSVRVSTGRGDSIPCELRLSAFDDGRETVGVLRNRTERRRLENERELLSRLVRSTAAAETVDEALAAALRDVCEATDWRDGEAWVPVEEGLELRTSTGGLADADGTRAPPDAPRVVVDDGFPNRVAESGSPEFRVDVRGENLPAGETRAEPTATLGVPVTEDGDVAAVLVFYTTGAPTPDERLADAVTAAATQLGSTLARTRREQQRRRERELTERILAAVPVSIAVLEPDGTFARANERAHERLGTPDAERYEVGARDVYDEDGEYVPPDERPYVRTFETGDPVTDWECQIDLPDRGRRWLSINARPVRDDDGDVERVVVAGEDVTTFKERTRRLERRRDELAAELEEVFDRITDGFFAVDDEWRFTYVNERAEELLDRSEGELIGESLWEAFPETVESRFQEEYEAAMATQEPVVFEEYYPPLSAWFAVRAYPSESGLSVYFRDVTERWKRDEELNARVRQQAVVSELGQSALEAEDVDGVVEETARLVAESLDAECCRVLEHRPSDEDVVVRAAAGRGVDGGATVAADDATAVATGGESPAGRAFRSGTAVLVEDFAEESRVRGPDLSPECDVASGLCVAIGSTAEPWGVLAVYGARPREFTERDVNFARSVANVVASAVDRHEYERRLERQREGLSTLDQLNRIVQEVTSEAVEATSRSELEREVCRRVADSDAYDSAWVGELGAGGGTVTLRTEAGVDGPLADEAGKPQAAAREALETREPQFVRDVDGDGSHESPRADADDPGDRSLGAIPIAYEDVRYGVLTVSTGRESAFDARERGILARLGEILGHAITAIERKEALVSDQVVEVTLRSEELARPFAAAATGDIGHIAVERSIPIDEEAFLLYFTVRGMDPDRFTEALERFDTVDAVRVLDDTEDGAWIESRVSPRTLASTFAERGGRVESLRIDGDSATIVAELPHDTDVRNVVEAVRERYPDMELVSRTTTESDQTSPRAFRSRLERELTDRQRTALETALYAGYFDWPRQSTGEEIAESLDVASATLHQHLRIGERKLLAAFFEGADERAGDG
jgi:PAS domain S-box-containing protein